MDKGGRDLRRPPTRCELIVNLKTAKSMALVIVAVDISGMTREEFLG
jgi:hypothetical protein